MAALRLPFGHKATLDAHLKADIAHRDDIAQMTHQQRIQSALPANVEVVESRRYAAIGEW